MNIQDFVLNVPYKFKSCKFILNYLDNLSSDEAKMRTFKIESS